MSKVAIELATSQTGSPAEMRLNTAEMNLVVLALFLQCAPSIGNPLGTILLDDPLQNMDDLTSATLARGISKLAALLPQGWQIVLMLHWDDDLETFRREVATIAAIWRRTTGKCQRVFDPIGSKHPFRRQSLWISAVPRPIELIRQHARLAISEPTP